MRCSRAAHLQISSAKCSGPPRLALAGPCRVHRRGQPDRSEACLRQGLGRGGVLRSEAPRHERVPLRGGRGPGRAGPLVAPKGARIAGREAGQCRRLRLFSPRRAGCPCLCPRGVVLRGGPRPRAWPLPPPLHHRRPGPPGSRQVFIGEPKRLVGQPRLCGGLRPLRTLVLAFVRLRTIAFRSRSRSECCHWSQCRSRWQRAVGRMQIVDSAS